MQRNKISFKGENVFVGIDVHLKQWHVCVRTPSVSHKPFTQPPSAKMLYDYLCRHFPDANYFSAYEVGFCGFSVHYNLEAAGIRNIVFNPADISDTQKERFRKTDAIDCSKICRNLLNGELVALHVPSRQLLADRNLIICRQSLVKDRIRTKQRIKSLLYANGIEYPDVFADNRSHWSESFLQWLESVFDHSGRGQHVRMAILLETLRFIKKRILELDRKIVCMIKARYQRMDSLLQTVPGIGSLTSAKLCVIIGDISRFDSPDSLAGYIGLVPDVRSSDTKESVLGITFRGNRVLRTALIESAWRSLSKDAALARSYTNYRNRGMHQNVAIVRIARKLVNRIYFVLTKGIPYVPDIVR